jgi:hypothetical protein
MAAKNEIDINVFTGPQDAQTLQNVIEALCPSAQSEITDDTSRTLAQFAILESLTDIRFPLPKKGEINLEEWPKGRLFAQAFELQWEKIEKAFRASFACDKNWTWPEPEKGFDLKAALKPVDDLMKAYTPDSERERYRVYLRPEHDNSLGRSLHYESLEATRPQTAKQENPNAVLQIKRYFDDHGRLLFWRYQSMRWE